MVYTLEKFTIIPLIRLWVKNAKGAENLPKTGGAIIASNHASYADHLIIGSFIATKVNRRFHFLAKKEHFEGPQKFWHKYVEAIPIDRKKGGKGALRFAVKGLKEGKLIVIYPEGTRTLTGKLQKAKTGVARLALLSGAPVIPIGLMGTFEIMPKGRYIPKFRRATINIGHPLYFKKHRGKNISKKLLRSVTTNIMKQIAKLSNQKYN